MSADAARLQTLEERVAFLEHHLEALGRAVTELDKAKRTLAGECASLRKRLAEVSDSGQSPILDEPPPHY